MLTIICIVFAISFLGVTVTLIWKVRDHRIDASIFQDALEKSEEETKDTISFLESLLGETTRRMGSLESALGSQLVNRSNEVGSPPPSGAYHTVFIPTGEGRVMMIYICLDTGHIARWHFHSPQAIEEEGKRFIEVAQEVREGTLPENPDILNVSIGNRGLVH